MPGTPAVPAPHVLQEYRGPVRRTDKTQGVMTLDCAVSAALRRRSPERTAGRPRDKAGRVA